MKKDYKIFEKDNLTLPTAIIQTNESGMATFVLPRRNGLQRSRNGS